MNEMQLFLLNEAKDHLKDVNEGIQRTREKCWTILAFMFGVLFYLMQKVIIESSANEVTKMLCIFSAIFTGLILYNLKYSILPSEHFRFNGDSGKNIKLILENGLNVFDEALYNYTNAIDKNKATLDKIKTAYNTAFSLVVCFFIIGLLLFLIGFVLCK